MTDNCTQPVCQAKPSPTNRSEYFLGRKAIDTH